MRIRVHLLGGFAASLLWCAAGCGTPGVPQPPSLALPAPPNDLAATRKGDRVALTWTEPAETTDRQKVRHLGLTVICRTNNEFPMQNCARVVKQLRPEELVSAPGATAPRPKVIYEDVLNPEEQNPTQFATYAIQVLNTRGKSAGFSNQVRVPLAPSAPPATHLRAEVTPDAVLLTWTGAVPPSREPRLAFSYRVFRKLANVPNYTLLQEVPLEAGEQRVRDRSFEWEQAYDYKVTGATRVQPASGEPVEFEGEDSAPIQVFAHDIFPPARPSGLQAVFSGVGQKPFIDLTWDPNTEPDLAGYNVFRAEPGGPAAQLNAQLVKAPSFRDENVAPGHRYIYSVSAVDVRGNQSPRSEVASELVPLP